mmetsp:Transcript_37080/g.109336  ORF Transcript_37080/g.109336 Transcript_37080/m.109336 type:complete len:247 (+) Transcript_37080:1063-1803(+)
MSVGSCPETYRVHAASIPASRPRTHRGASKSAQVWRTSLRRARSEVRRLTSTPSATARSSYSCRLHTTMCLPRPVAAATLAATRCAILRPGSVSSGTPDHSASTAPVCALHAGVSRKTSAASDSRDRCAAFRSTSVNTSAAGGAPAASAASRTLLSASAGKRSSHSTLPGTRARTRHHTPSVAGSSLYSWLQQQYTTAGRQGRPRDNRIASAAVPVAVSPLPMGRPPGAGLSKSSGDAGVLAYRAR